MLRRIVAALFVVLCFVLQSSVFDKIAFGGIVPNLLIILVAVYGFMHGEIEGLIVGFFSGLLVDIFFGNFLGFYALIYMYVGFCNGKFNGIFYPEDIKLPFALIAASNLTVGILSYVLLFMLRGRFEFIYYFRHIILPECVYTIIVSIILYPLVLKIDSVLDNEPRRSW